MRPGPWLLVAGDAAGLLALVIFVGHPNFRHPGLTSVTRRLSNDAGDACKYCERLPRDWEKRVCGILSGGAGDGRGFADFFFSGIAANATRAPRWTALSHRLARAQGEEVRLTGGAGDGYCFDTNSIHAGELSGRKARYVVVMEFHSGIIEDAFSRHGLRFRSPFGLR